MEEYFLKKKYFKENIENYIDLNQKKNFGNFLDFICSSNKININEQNSILITLREKLIIYLLNNREYLDEYIIANLITYQNNYKDLIKNEKSLIDFIKLINFVKIFTININMTSQIMSNVINLLNNTIEEFIINSSDKFEIKEDNIFPILKLLELNCDLSININSYNPRLNVFISRIIFFIVNKSEISNNNYLKFFPEVNSEKFVIKKIEEIITKLSDNIRNDINYEIIFKEIYEIIINSEQDIKNNFWKFITDYENINKKNILKKKIHMNYLVIKKKPLQFLQPDYDLSFLGDFPEYVNKEEKSKKINYILKHKTRNTEKQAIRKLKKEAKILDEERQKVVDEINKKRKEDIKFVNQYLEQQNIEYKKMMSSNERKRFKFKKKKTK